MTQFLNQAKNIPIISSFYLDGFNQVFKLKFKANEWRGSGVLIRNPNKLTNSTVNPGYIQVPGLILHSTRASYTVQYIYTTDYLRQNGTVHDVSLHPFERYFFDRHK